MGIDQEHIKIKKSAIDIEFNKIGRALNSKYYAYFKSKKATLPTSILVCDDKNFVFERTRVRDWFSLGPSGYRIFREHFAKGLLIEIKFDV